MSKSVVDNIRELFANEVVKEKDIDKISKYLYFMNESYLVFRKDDLLSYEDVYNILKNISDTIINGFYETNNVENIKEDDIVDVLFDLFRRLILDFIDIDEVLAELNDKDIDEDYFYEVTYNPSIEEWDTDVLESIINSILENGEWNFFETETARLLASNDKIDNLLGAIIQYSVLLQLKDY